MMVGPECLEPPSLLAKLPMASVPARHRRTERGYGVKGVVPANP